MQEIKIRIDRGRIVEFCKRWQISEFAFFGSVLRDDFESGSDVDVLVTFAREARHGLFQLNQMREELEQIFARKVDLVSRRGLDGSRNFLRRRAILDSAEVLYAA